jgi:hypothetical protein
MANTQPTNAWGGSWTPFQQKISYNNQGQKVNAEGQLVDDSGNPIVSGKDANLTTINPIVSEDDKNETSGRRRPFKSLFGKIKEGLGRVGSAQFDEEAFLDVGKVDDEGKSLERENPNYGKYLRDPDDPTKIIGKGEGLFGKEGGFMSKFGTGRGLLGEAMGDTMREGVGDALSEAGEDLIYSGGYQYGDFYDGGDEY